MGGPTEPAPEILECLRAIPTPPEFTYAVTLQEIDGPQRVQRNSGIAEDGRSVASTMGRAIEIAVENVIKDLREAEGYRAAEAWRDAHPGDDLTMDISAQISQSIQIDLIIDHIIVERYPVSWQF